MPRVPITHPLALERLTDAQRGGNLNLLQAAIAIATHAHPTLSVPAIHDFFDRITRDGRHMLEHENPLPSVLQHLLFQRFDFHGNRENYADPNNSYLDQVILRCTGLPILLSLIYVETATRLGAAAHGVGLPGHFIAALDPGHDPEQRIYLDPFNRGVILTLDDCRRAALTTGSVWHDALLAPVTPLAWALRILANLHNAYLQRHDVVNTAAVVEQILLLDPTNERRQRELRELYAQLDRHIARNN